MKIFISSNRSLNSDRAELVKFIEEICREYNSQLIEIITDNTSTEDELMLLVAGCDLFITLTDTDVENHVMKEFNAATLCNVKGTTPIIYVYNKEPKEDVETNSKNYDLFTQYLIDESKRLWNRYEHIDFMRIIFALQLEAFNPNLFETKLIGSKVYLRNLEVGDMLKSSAVLYSSNYDNMQQCYDQTAMQSQDSANNNENVRFQQAVIARNLNNKRQDLLDTYYGIYKQMATLPSRNAASQLRIGFNNIFNGNTTNSLKVLNVEELTATATRIIGKIKSNVTLDKSDTLELEGAIEAMGLRAQVLMTDILNPHCVDQAIEAMQKAIIFSRESKISSTIYAQHITAYADFLNRYKGNPDGAKWYEGVLDMLINVKSNNHMLLAKAYINVANFSIDNDDHVKAMWALKEALSIVSKVSPYSPLMGLIYLGFAKLHNCKGEYLEALTCCTKGEKLYLMTHSAADITSLKLWFMQINLRKNTSQPGFTEAEFLEKEQILLKYYGKDEPLIDFYLFFADFYAEDNRFKESADILEKALVISDYRLGNLCNISQRILYRLSYAYRYMGDNQSALSVAEELIRRLKLAPEPQQDMKMAADVYFAIGRINISLNKYNEALESFSNALKIFSSVVGEDCNQMGDCYKHIAEVFFKCEQYEQSIKYNTNALDIIIKRYGEASVNAALFYNRIAESYMRIGDYAKALELYHRTIKLDNGGKVDDNILDTLGFAYFGVGEVYIEAKDYSAAKEAYETMLKRFGDDDSILYSELYLKYAMALIECGDDQAALTNFFKSLNIKEKEYGDENKYAAPIYIEVGKLYEKYEMVTDALAYYTKGLRSIIKHIGENHEYTMMNYCRVARMRMQNGDYREAFDAATHAKNIYEMLNLDSKIEYATIYDYLSDSLVKLAQSKEEIEQALAYKKSAFELYVQLDHIFRVITQRNMGFIYEKLWDYQNAFECFKYELDYYEKESAPSPIHLANINEHLARALFFMDDEASKKRAAEYLLKSYTIFENENSIVDMLRVVSSLATIYNTLEDYENEKVCLDTLMNLYNDNEEHKDDESYAGVLQRLGVACCKQYEYGDSEKYLKEALELFTKCKGEESEEVVSVYNDMTNLYYVGERNEDAAIFGEQTLKGRRKFNEPNSDEVLDAMHNLELIYCEIGAYDQAIKLVMERVDLIKSREGDNDITLAIAYYHVGNVYKSKGDYRKQVEWLEASIKLEESLSDKSNTSIAMSLFSLGEAYRLWGIESDNKEVLLKAQEVLLRMADIYEECGSLSDLSESEITNWATAYIYVSNIRSAFNDYEDALAYVEAAEVLFKANKDNENQIYCYNSYAMIYSDMKAYDKSIEFYNKALQTMDEDDVNRYVIYGNIARCYQDCCDFEKMLDYMTRAYDVTFGLLDDDDYNRAKVYTNLGDAYLEVGDYAKSKECFNEALYIYEKKGEESTALSSQLSSMGYITLLNKEYDKSIEYNKRALDIRIKIEGEKSLLTANSYSYLGRVYAYTGRLKEARELLFKALDIRKSLIGDKPSLEVAAAYYSIGELLIKEGKYDEAAQFLLDSITYYTKMYNDQHIYVARSLHSLGEAYKLSGDVARAACYLNVALSIRTKCLRENHPCLIATRELLAQ